MFVYNVTLVSIWNANDSIAVKISIIIWINDELNDQLSVHEFLLNLLTRLKQTL